MALRKGRGEWREQAALHQEAVDVVQDPHGGDGQGAEAARHPELIL
jgi:hypothetical protein